MNRNNILSIIIPAYNAEKYISNTINYILNSKLQAEVIIINDGSKDNTLVICKELQKQYPNLEVITQQNKGVSAARNLGIKYSHGKWLFFCDADDWIDVRGITLLLEKAEELGEEYLMMGAMNFIKPNGTFLHAVPDDKMLNPRDYLNSNIFQGSSCNYLFSSKLVRDNNIFFPENVVNTEDSNFNIKAVCCCKSIYSLNIPIYNYNHMNIMAAHRSNVSLQWRMGPLLSAYDVLNYCKERNITVDVVSVQIDRLVEYYYRSYIYGHHTFDDLKYIRNILEKISEFCPIIAKSLKFKAIKLQPYIGLSLIRIYNYFRIR